MKIRNAVRHLITITSHRHAVIRHARKAGILWQALGHDMSKYSPAEFLSGVRYYAEGKRSPNEIEREKHGYSSAWLHHKGRNKHHFEYWNDLSPVTKQYESVPMPLRYVAEMFCDRVAASKIYQGEAYTDRHPLDYYLRGDAKRKMHPDTAACLEAWLRLLAEEGEDAAFLAIRETIREAKKK